MPEGVLPYPRWQGTLSPKSRIPVIIRNEVRGAIRSRWSLIALALGIAWGFASIIEFYNTRGSGVSSHGWEGFIQMHEQLLWFSLGLAAALGGPALLEDSRLGALDLYLARSVTTWEYLTGKIGALLALTSLLVFVPSVVYWASSYVFYDVQPDGWLFAVARSLVYALMWGLMVSGLALGLSSASRSAAGAALLLFGGFVTLAYLVDPPALLQRVAPITELTEDPRWAILSPFAAMEAQAEWLFPDGESAPFPFWWGLIVWGALTAFGWALLIWRRPRVRGEGSTDGA